MTSPSFWNAQLAERPVWVFDLNDTLYPEAQFVAGGLAAAGRWARENLGLEGFEARCQAHFDAGRRGDLFDRALAELGQAAAPGVVGALVAAYRGHRPDLRLFPDAAALLPRLAGRRWGVLTDGPLAVQRAKAAALGLDRLAPALVLSDTWGRDAWKPSPRPFAEAARLLGAAPAACVSFGDNPAKDFLGARRAGWTAVRVRRPGTEHAAAEPAAPEAAPDAELPSLALLLAALGSAGDVAPESGGGAVR